jgi:membrane-associated phospholipid phosphatase
VGLRRAVPAPNDRRLLAPPWAPAAAVLAALVTVALARLAWHSRQLPGVDAWVKDRLGADSARELRLATEVAGGLRSVTIVGIVAVAALAWGLLRQRNAVILVLLAPTVTLVAERLLKPLVGRRAPESTVFHFPSGHVAVATAVALCLVLVVRSVRTRPATRTVAVLSAGLLVLLMGLIRMIDTAHVLSDVVAGAATGVAVTLAMALLLDGRRRAGGGSLRGGLLELQPEGLGQAGVQRADRQHGQRDRDRGQEEVVEDGDERPEEE